MSRRLLFCLLLVAAVGVMFDNRMLPAGSLNSGLTSAQGQGFTISGLITQGTVPGSGPGISGVTVTLLKRPSTQVTTQTDSNGNFSFANVPSGTDYEVTPSKTDWTFQPTSQGGVLTQDRQMFFTGSGGTSPSNSVQFAASTDSTTEAPNTTTTVNVIVTRVGDASGAASVDYATTDSTASERSDYMTAIGKLRFAAGETSKSISVFIVNDSYGESPETFLISLSNPLGTSLGAPSVETITINSDEAGNGPNPVNSPLNTDFFVRQHYVDFFNRAADSSGLGFWKNQLDECTTDQCRDLRKTNVSAAFYLSIEFQQTGYLVERIYKASYGDATGTSVIDGSHQLPVPIVRFKEFLADTQQIGTGVVVGQTGWETVLENNKGAFTAEFVQRSRFLSAFPTSMTAAQYVDQLNANAGNPLSQSERDQLVANLISGAITRAAALRTVAEDSDFSAAESNRAFVLMQFFGYLRRNPNDSPDSDHSGYDFWLKKLNQFNGNFVNAEMVKSFLVSGEYIHRFGP